MQARAFHDGEKTRTCVHVGARIVVAVLLIVGGLGALAFQLWWAWGWTDNTIWGAWGKPQTHEQHVEKFVSYLVKFYWPPVLGSVAGIAAGVLLCFWRMGKKEAAGD